MVCFDYTLLSYIITTILYCTVLYPIKLCTEGLDAFIRGCGMADTLYQVVNQPMATNGVMLLVTSMF